MLDLSMCQNGEQMRKVFDEDAPPSDPDEFREFLQWWWEVRLPVLQEICAINLAEIKRLQEDYARRVARRRRWWIFG